jgi:mRNA-degrading endonuclease RelE of RelBE toxin-antitoxin system
MRGTMTGGGRLGNAESMGQKAGVAMAPAAGQRAGPAFPMFQVSFSSQAIHELNRLDKLTQLTAIEPISALRVQDLERPREPLGRFQRGTSTLYRLRAGSLRFYFEYSPGNTLHVIYILQQHSLEDFLLRNKLPVSEEQLVEQHSKFWKYLETLTK